MMTFIRSVTSNLGIMAELLQFFWHRKFYWLLPLILLLLVFGLLLVFASASSVAPFIYTLF